MHRSLSTTTLLILLAAYTSAKTSSKAPNAVLLSNVRSLTLQFDKETSNRRVPAIPQLTCVGGNAKGLYYVDVMRCANSGSEYDAEDIQWTCQASLPPEFKLGGTEVICEGYDNADDPYILKGSCGVEYRLVLTDVGEKRYSAFGQKSTKYDSFNGFSKRTSNILTTFWNILFWGVFAAVVCILLYRVFFPEGRIALPNVGGFGGGGGGGGGGGDEGGFNDDPPPPYTPRASPRPKTQSTPRSAPRSGQSRSKPSSSSSGPGFWGGAATGGAAGYGAGYYMGRQSQARDRERSRERERERERERDREREASSRYGGFFGGGGGGGPSSFGGGGSSSSPSGPAPSSSRYESTGFGGTRRR